PAGTHMFQNLTKMAGNASDSMSNLRPARTFRIEDATTDLRGSSYDKIKKEVAIAEKGDRTLVNGRNFIFANFSNIVNGSSDVINPTRVITGPRTGLVAPVDVAMDTRAGGVYLYVADRAAKKIFRFKSTDNGDVEPDDVLDTSELGYGVTPVGLALDARD